MPSVTKNHQAHPCPSCGDSLEGSEMDGLCPRCLLLGCMSMTEPTRTGAVELPGMDELAPFFPAFDFKERIGSGGMGVVYRAVQTELQREVAIKVLINEEDGSPEFSERFRREAQTLARLNHPNIITVHDFGEVDDFFFIVMECVDGTNLAKLIDSGQIRPAESLGLVIQICQALQYAHDAGVVHRDIKPANILINSDGQVKIADFGLAKVLGSQDNGFVTTKKERLGTPLYMAPEQRRAAVEADHRADIYSLGVVFYEMLTGDLPSGNFPPPSKRTDVDTRVDQVVLKSMESEPDRRYQQAGDVRSRVEEIRDHPSRGIKKPWLLWVAFVGIALFAIIALLPLTKKDQQEPVVVSVDEAPRLLASTPADGDWFGFAIHFEDGLAIIGVPQGSTRRNSIGTGFVEVKIRTDGGKWETAATLIDEQGSLGQRFGGAVAANDRYLVVGAPHARPGDNSGSNGVLCIFDRLDPDPANWRLLQRVAPDAAAGHLYFGATIAIDGTTIAIGDRGAAQGRGKVAVLEQYGSKWRITQQLTVEGASPDDRFGRAIDMEGDWLVSGAYLEESETGGNESGAAYVFKRGRGGEWSQVQRLTGIPGSYGEQLGFSVDLEGSRLAIGAPNESIGSGFRQGAVYLYDLSGDSWTFSKRIAFPNLAASNTDFGHAIDLNRDALLVGAESVTHRGRKLGAAYLFERNRGKDGWGLAGKLFHPEAASADNRMGYSVRLLEGKMAVGSPRAMIEGVRSGAVYVLERPLRP